MYMYLKAIVIRCSILVSGIHGSFFQHFFLAASPSVRKASSRAVMLRTVFALNGSATADWTVMTDRTNMIVEVREKCDVYRVFICTFKGTTRTCTGHMIDTFLHVALSLI